MIPKRTFVVALLAVMVALPAAAQAPAAAPVRVRGTIVKLDDHTLVVASREGPQLSITLAPDYTVQGMTKKSLDDIKDGNFVASTSVKGADGALHAIELHILPDSLRGVAREGQFPWDLVPDSLMTNATAAGIATAPQGHIMHVTYAGGSADIVVAPDTPIVGYVPADPGLLKPGAAIIIFAQKGPDGSLSAARVTAEKDGVKPPM